MRIIKISVLLICLLCAKTGFAQNKTVKKSAAVSSAQVKKVDQLLKAGAGAALEGIQALTLNDYVIQSSMNSRAIMPDPTRAGSNIIISFTGTPESGSDAVALNITFVPEATLYDKAEYSASNKTIYLTMPLSQYPVIINQLERTIDKTGGKKLRGIWLDAGASGTIGVVRMF